MNDAPISAPLPEGLAELHAGLLTLDTHIDIPWPAPPDPHGATTRCVDIPKMREGGLWAGCFVAYIPQGPRTEAGHAAAIARTVAMLEHINAMARPDGERPVLVTPRVDDIRRAREQGAVAVIPVIENGYGIGTDLGNVERFANMGVRYMTLTHNGHNAIGDAAIPRGDLGDAPFLHGGLSAFGREVVAECNRTGILVDISHTSRETMLQAAEISKVPVVASHSCVCALCNHPRNLDDVQLDVIRERGGVAQITAVPFFVRPHGRAETVRVGDFVDHIDYAVRRMGIAHVGISSDFDGGGGFDGWRDASQTPNITAELMRRGYSKSDIEALWAGNFLRAMRQAEEYADRHR